MPHLYVQESMFESDCPTPCIASLNVASVDGNWSLGLEVSNLATLEPIALTATPGLAPLIGRREAHAALSELLDVLARVSHSPFS